MTNQQPSCSREGKSDGIPNTFKEVMGLPQAAHWKAALYKEITGLKKHGVFELVLQRYGIEGCNPAYTPVVTGGEAAERGGEAALPGDHFSRICTSHKPSATASLMRPTSWQRSCPSPRKFTWGRPSVFFATWPGL